ncbi:cyclic nucleotide-gated ion channel 1 [Quercus suber]|uniref:Cyclic nucleotide-gated ion channel 1 n=1 Tax=Quercus suber TaxID=58331 RepID=A0AAW0L0S9_QUESU
MDNVGQFLHYGFEIEGQHSSTERNPDPHRRFSHAWSIIFRLSCVIAVSLDPLFFYVPVINEENKCIELDKKLRTLAPILRTFTDIICLLNIALQFYNGYIDENSKNATLIKDPWKIARRYLWPYLVIDILVLLPIPQVAILILFREVRGSKALGIRKYLTAVLLFQYVPRVLGALWYLLSIERETACWLIACQKQPGCVGSSFNCDDQSLGNRTFLTDSCPINTPNTTDMPFDFGIFRDALQSGVVHSKDFPQKFFRCFWWGLRNLRSGAQLYMQLETARSEKKRKKMKQEREKKEEEERMKMEEKLEMEEKKRTIGIWMFKYRLPREMKKQIMQNIIPRLERKKDVCVENLFCYLPEDISNAVKRCLCLDLLKKVPVLQNMDEQLLKNICDSLKPVYYKERSYIVREGDPIDATFFITDGIAWAYTSSNGEASSSSSHAERLEKGHFFGEELLELGLSKLSRLPLSPRTVKTHGPIEAFALMDEDLKKIISKNWMHVAKEQLEPFAAYVVQAAWRRHHENKNLERSSHGGR